MTEKRCPVCDLDLDFMEDEENKITGCCCPNDHYAEYYKLDEDGNVDDGNITLVLNKKIWTDKKVAVEAEEFGIDPNQVLEANLIVAKYAWQKELAEKNRKR